MDKLFDLYRKMVLLHIGTKANDLLFHQASEKFYSTLFDIFHQISEKNQDIEIDEPIDCDEARRGAYSLLEQAKKELRDMIGENGDIGMDNLLRGLYDSLEFDCGTSRGLMKEEKEETEEVETPLSNIKTKINFIPGGY